MIDIKEIRIGNIIRHNVKDDETGGFTEPNEDAIPEDDFLCFLSMDEQLAKAEYIPITEEWLLKLDFTRHHRDYYNSVILLKEIDVWDLMLYPQGEKPESAVNMNQKVKYVHQLQNLYFALTGTELLWKK